MRKIKITENQLKVISKVILETKANVSLRNKLHTFLEDDYEQNGGVKKMGNQFFDTPLIKKKVDGEIITPQTLCSYMCDKFSGVAKSIVIDAIKGWFIGDYNKETGMRKKV
tara:strand:+ start:8340 stop:8672 length:333 start_codon:yes stop_codon:yes gene_type:complete